MMKTADKMVLNKKGVNKITFFDDIEKYSDNVAIIGEGEERYTYGDLVKAADELAGFLPGRELVFLICRNDFYSVAAYIGFLRKRAVPVLINPDINKDLFNNLLESYRPNYICCPNGWWGSGRQVYCNAQYRMIGTGYNYSHELYPQLALLLTTSGSTGSPKLVRQSYLNITSNASSISEYLGITAEDRPITTLPMHYTYGLSIINSHLLMGASVIMTEATLMEKKFWHLLKSQEATTFGGVPYTYEMLKKLRFSGMDLPSLRYITQAGGKLSRELSLEFVQTCRKKGIKFIVMYGQTEATARMSYLPWEYAETKAGSIGIAIPGGSFSLADSDGYTIEESGAIGELVYRGENVTLGYAQNRDDLGKGDENGGVLYTGDMAERDSDGFYYIVGRKKRFLKIFGNRVNLDEMENLLKSAGYNCACAGSDDNMKIIITGGQKKDEIRVFIIEKTGLNTAGFSIIAVGEIPRNEAGKVLYGKLEELYD